MQSHLERELDQVVLRLRAAADLAVLLAHQQHARREQAPLEHRQQPPSQLRGLHVERRKSRVNTQHGTGKRGDAREQSIAGRAGMGSLNDQRDEALGSLNLLWVAQISRGSHLQSRRQLEAVSGALCAQLLKACLCSRVCDRSFWRGQVRHVARWCEPNAADDALRPTMLCSRATPRTQRAASAGANTALQSTVDKCAPHFLNHFSVTQLWKYFQILYNIDSTTASRLATVRSLARGNYEAPNPIYQRLDYLNQQLLDGVFQLLDLVLQLRAFVGRDRAGDNRARHAARAAECLLVRHKHVRDVLRTSRAHA